MRISQEVVAKRREKAPTQGSFPALGFQLLIDWLGQIKPIGLRRGLLTIARLGGKGDRADVGERRLSCSHWTDRVKHIPSDTRNVGFVGACDWTCSLTSSIA
jgi:hypothetical protein